MHVSLNNEHLSNCQHRKEKTVAIINDGEYAEMQSMQTVVQALLRKQNIDTKQRDRVSTG